MFPDRGYNFNGLKHLTEKVTAVVSLTRVRVVVDNTMPTPHNKVKDVALIFWSVFTPSRLHLLSKTYWASVSLRNFFTHTHLLRCLSSMVNLIAVTTLLLMLGLHRCWQRIFKNNTNYFYSVRISISLSIMSEIFIQIDYFFWEICKKTTVPVDVFFWTQCILLGNIVAH